MAEECVWRKDESGKEEWVITLGRRVGECIKDGNSDVEGEWNGSESEQGGRNACEAGKWWMQGGYAMNPRIGSMHKMIMGERPEGVSAKYVIDHKDRDRRNNSRENLRWVTQSFNAWNAVRGGGRSRFRGVKYADGGWESSFCGKYVGRYREEREAAKGAAYEAIREWGEWAAESDLLFGEDLLTEEERQEVIAQVSREGIGGVERVKKGRRGVQKRGVGEKMRYEAWYRKRYIGKYETEEEASAAYSARAEEEERKDWERHRSQEISRDERGVACIRLSGKGGQGRIALVSDEDWHELTYRQSWYRCVAKKNVYAKWGSGKVMHKEVFMKCNEELGEGESIDHKNGETLDNRRENLRRATHSEQSHNKRKRAGCSSEYYGVSRIGSRWGGTIMKEGKKYPIGMHATEEEAALAYNRVATKLYGEKAQLNVIKRRKISGDIRDFMIRAK